MRRGHWFLPASPDLLGMLDRQAAITVEGLDAFAAWAAGDADAGDAVRACEHRADAAKQELVASLRTAFVTPIEPEDLFALSRGIDWVLNHAKDAIGEAELMSCPPDAAIAEMAVLLARATRELSASIAGMRNGAGGAGDSADAAVKAERHLEKAYRHAMAALLETDDLREQIARRELYRCCSRIGEAVVDVAERVDYAIIKQS
jgi:uncharacterized protein Yka (UPF0111/DUF47 family)